ncbi:hypothetical protein CMV_016675 [Castanea mollissima]|uniref:Hydroxyproline-rich glycoprotein family protein n=1 Tax=Castanea mollissima TaxID=60419 RepID=A0A8J4VHX7_9ROSI|nr:hypothetical protein CMV_016675 [Castanea mollissima]
MRSANNSVETINAAATAIVSAETRVQPTTSSKRRWGSCWSLYWCFGSQKNSKRISHAVLGPEPVVPGAAVPANENPTPPTAIVLPFIAPPSSPASFLQSDPPSASQSPAKFLSLTSLSVNAYSPGSPGGYLISPGSAISNSGTSTPFPDRRPILEFRMGESPKLLGFDHFSARKWGSRLGSGSLTPDGVGLGSRLGSGSLTPDGMGLGSRLNSGSMTPDGVGLGSRLGSGSLTPDVMGPASRGSYLLENQISESVSLANLGNGCQNNGTIIDHRVSFELTGEDVARCLANKSAASIRNASESSQDIVAEAPTDREGIKTDTNNCYELPVSETSSETPEKASEEGEEQSYRKHRSVSLGSIKEFNFDNTKGEVSDKPTIGSAWWANEKVSGKEARPGSNWAFFPMLQSGVS